MSDKNLELDGALELIKKEDFESAKSKLLCLFEKQPQNIEIIKSLGLCNVNLKCLDEALENFKCALKLNKDDALCWFYLGTIQESIDEFEKAKKSFLKVIELREDYLDAYKSLGVLYLKTQENAKFLKYAQKLEEIGNEDYQIYYLLALANIGLQKYEEAIILLKKAIKLNPKHAVIYNNLAAAYMALGSTDEALNAFLKAFELDFNNQSAAYNAATIYQAKEQHTKAYVYFKKAYELQVTDFYLNAVALGSFNAQEWRDSIIYYNMLVNLNPEKQNYQYNLACAYQAVKEYTKAISILENLVVLNPNSLLMIDKLANLYIETGNFEAAKNLYSSLMEKGNASPDLYYNYAILCARTNDMDKAENIFKKVIRLAPEKAIVHKDLGVIYLSKRLFDYAKDEFETAYKLEKNNPYILFEYANYWYLMSDYKQADKLYLKLLKYDDLPAHMYISIAVNLIALNKTKSAIEFLEKARQYEPHNPNILLNLAKAYFMKKKYDIAQQLLEDAYFANPNIEIANMLATVYFENENYKEAKKIFNIINNQIPESTSNLTNLAKCEIKTGCIDRAKELLLKVINIFPEAQEAQDLLEEINKGEA